MGKERKKRGQKALGRRKEKEALPEKIYRSLVSNENGLGGSLAQIVEQSAHFETFIIRTSTEVGVEDALGELENVSSLRTIKLGSAFRFDEDLFERGCPCQHRRSCLTSSGSSSTLKGKRTRRRRRDSRSGARSEVWG